MKRKDILREKVKRVRRLSRLLHGRPGQGRKTHFTDRKKQAALRACRGREPDNEQPQG